MPFSQSQIESLLHLKGIGPTVIRRLEEMGLDDVALLAASEPADILEQGATLSGSTCWKNSPQAKAAVEAAVAWAKQQAV